MFAPHSTGSAKSPSTLSQWLASLGLGHAPEAAVDGSTVALWQREGKAMRAQESARAEKPPLLSY
jgi:hypothetical protein